MLQVFNLDFGYGKNKSLFKNLDLQVSAGETLAILGPNGVGKTSLIKCILGFLKPRNGEIQVNGENFKDIKGKTFWKKVSYVPQSKPLNFAYTVLEMVLLGRASAIGMGQSPSKKDVHLAEQALELVGIPSLRDRYCHLISGGELQLVLIARAIVSDPELLVLDEPESSLDMKNQLIILEVLERLKKERNMTTVLNTHYPNHALRIAEKSLLMGYGAIHDIGKTKALITEETIRTFFHVESSFFNMKEEGGHQKTLFFPKRVSS